MTAGCGDALGWPAHGAGAPPPHATLLLIEQLVPADPGPHWSKTLDIHMLTLLGGRNLARLVCGPHRTCGKAWPVIRRRSEFIGHE